MRAPVDGLNLVLHDATVLDVELGPDDLTCDIPPELANQIRPRFPEMSRERLSPPGWLRRLGRSHGATGRCRGRPTVGKDPQVVRKRRVDVVTKDDSTSSEIAALPGDRRAKVTADVQRPNGRVVTVRFLIFRNADLGVSSPARRWWAVVCASPTTLCGRHDARPPDGWWRAMCWPIREIRAVNGRARDHLASSGIQARVSGAPSTTPGL